MATLFDRMVGYDPNTGQDLEDGKLSIHAFIGAINEIGKGEITGQEAAQWFELTPEQQQDMIALNDLVNSANNRTSFMRTLKDILYMGEARLDGRYITEQYFWNRLSREVTRG